MSLTTNLWKRLKQLLPEAPLLVGTVDSVSAYGAIVMLPDGSLLNVRGDTTVGTKVFVRNGVIEGTAPTLTVVEIDI